MQLNKIALQSADLNRSVELAELPLLSFFFFFFCHLEIDHSDLFIQKMFGNTFYDNNFNAAITTDLLLMFIKKIFYIGQISISLIFVACENSRYAIMTYSLISK